MWSKADRIRISTVEIFSSFGLFIEFLGMKSSLEVFGINLSESRGLSRSCVIKFTAKRCKHGKIPPAKTQNFESQNDPKRSKMSEN